MSAGGSLQVIEIICGEVAAKLTRAVRAVPCKLLKLLNSGLRAGSPPIPPYAHTRARLRRAMRRTRKGF